MTIAIFGSGYVGLVTSTCFAAAGVDVIGVDVDPTKVKRLQQGECPIYEPGLQNLMQEGIAAERLSFTGDAGVAVAAAEILFIAVGTPPDEDGHADLQYVLAVAHSIGRSMDNPRIVVTKSTVPVGTADKVAEAIRAQQLARGVEIPFEVVSNPEFLKEGSAVADFQKPDRIVIGSDSPTAIEAMKALYAPFNRNHDRIVVMDVRSAELTKYAANAMLATKISFMNELANLAERLGADIERVRIGIGSDPRIGFQFIWPGCGYGGSCFPKDVQALVRTAQQADYVPELLQAVEAVNQFQKHRLHGLISQHFGGAKGLDARRFAVWGLAFKPNTDDMREAPSRELLKALWADGATVAAYDPKAAEEAERLYPEALADGRLILASTKEDATEGADALVICTEWKRFMAPNFDQLAASLRQKLIFDGRNLYDPARLAELGWTYYAIGRGASVSPVL
jgi:UDPglucose 6-dehydrogenase